ncbi:hypothetical protein ABE485_18810 [Achromobacter spanius]|uniref:hypothetical protein n=1 Tax=Achromobacter spanius TaxID=217203 RepID=UPI003208B355
MPRARHRANVLNPLVKIDSNQHTHLRRQGAQGGHYWNIDEHHVDHSLVTAYRSEVKDHYYYRQARRCCYCSKELDKHKRSYDAEHIISKDSCPHLMFETNNIAASCLQCNGAKYITNVLAGEAKPDSVPIDSKDYIIVHPHLDEWENHLEFDKFERVVAKPGDRKGSETIRICKIEKLNRLRLSDYFLPGDNKLAEKTIEGFYKSIRVSTKKKKFELLEKISSTIKGTLTEDVLALLKDELDRAIEAEAAAKQRKVNVAN